MTILIEGDEKIIRITTAGPPGASAYASWLAEGNSGSVDDFFEFLRGPGGYNAYELAVIEGFSGSVEDWLDSLVGEQGENGLSAYEIALQNGFSGSESAWLASLVGDPGAQGDDGAPGSRFFHGSAAPVSGAVPGDYFLDDVYGVLYEMDINGNFQFVMILKGAGGSDGTDGVDGRTIYAGSGVPSGGIGADGDFYYDTTNNRFYGPKASGAWGAGINIVGPPGTTDYNDLDNLPTLGSMAAEDTTDYYTVTAANSAISTAISNLIDSSPGTLDTLNELAAALGDDPNFATTVSTSLADRITGPASAADTEVFVANGTTGKLARRTPVTISSGGNIATPGTVTAVSGLIYNAGAVTNLTIRGGTNSVSGTAEPVLSIRNTDNTLTACIRRDGLIMSAQIGTIDDSTMTMVDTSIANGTLPAGLNQSYGSMLSWSSYTWWFAKDTSLMRESAGVLQIGNGGWNDSGKLRLGQIVGNTLWKAGLIEGQYGGTGVNNSGKTITLGGNLTTSGAYSIILTAGANTNVTLPASGTLATTADIATAVADVEDLIDDLDLLVNKFTITMNIFTNDDTAITSGLEKILYVPEDITITGWTILGDISGSIVVDVQVGDYSTYPTSASIAGTEKPTLSSAVKNQDNVLSTWTPDITGGQFLKFVVESASTVKSVQVLLYGQYE